MKRLIVVLVLGVLMGEVFAADPGKTAMAFLKVGQGARITAMGEAFVGLADDVNALYWNPAGLAKIKDRQATFMYLRPFQEVDGLSYSHMATTIPRGKEGSYGISLSYFGYGKEEKTDENAKVIGNWTAFDSLCSIGGAMQIQKNLAVGGSAKLIYGEIDKSNAVGLACDIGCLYLPRIKNTTLGAVIKNIGTKVRFEKDSDPLPLCAKIGLSHKLERLPIIFVADATIPNDNNPYIGAGLEANLQKTFAVRLGARSGPADEGSGLTAGLGINHRLFSFDFAYQPGDCLGDSYFVSLSTKY
ncbi:MAG: PorV/PorQ family protein [bacterium]|nr:PorV/PorQ family protein [bacterium]